MSTINEETKYDNTCLFCLFCILMFSYCEIKRSDWPAFFREKNRKSWNCSNFYLNETEPNFFHSYEITFEMWMLGNFSVPFRSIPVRGKLSKSGKLPLDAVFFPPSNSLLKIMLKPKNNCFLIYAIFLLYILTVYQSHWTEFLTLGTSPGGIH